MCAKGVPEGRLRGAGRTEEGQAWGASPWGQHEGQLGGKGSGRALTHQGILWAAHTCPPVPLPVLQAQSPVEGRTWAAPHHNWYTPPQPLGCCICGVKSYNEVQGQSVCEFVIF